MKVYDKGVLTVEKTAHGYHVATWTGFGKGATYREPMEACLPILKRQRSGAWIADLSEWAPTSSEDQQWTVEEWFRKAVAAGLRSMIVVLPSSALSNLSVKRVMSKAGDIEVAQHFVGSLEEAHEVARGARKAA